MQNNILNPNWGEYLAIYILTDEKNEEYKQNFVTVLLFCVNYAEKKKGSE